MSCSEIVMVGNLYWMEVMTTASINCFIEYNLFLQVLNDALGHICTNTDKKGLQKASEVLIWWTTNSSAPIPVQLQSFIINVKICFCMKRVQAFLHAHTWANWAYRFLNVSAYYALIRQFAISQWPQKRSMLHTACGLRVIQQSFCVR